MGNDDFRHKSRDADLINDWAMQALRGLIHTDREVGSAGMESPICQAIWGNAKVARVCRWLMRYTRWVRYKERQRGQFAELQMATVSLQGDIIREREE